MSSSSSSSSSSSAESALREAKIVLNPEVLNHKSETLRSQNLSELVTERLPIGDRKQLGAHTPSGKPRIRRGD